MRLSSARGAFAFCVRWWRTALHMAVTGIVIAVVSHNATSPYPAVPADGSPSAPHVRTLP